MHHGIRQLKVKTLVKKKTSPVVAMQNGLAALRLPRRNAAVRDTRRILGMVAQGCAMETSLTTRSFPVIPPPSMSETFTKLFQSILRSTIWQEDSDTKVVWVTLLALADKNGYVGASLPGIAAAAGVSLTAAETAMHKFQQPDRYSRSQEHEGRRIALAERGWTLLNYAKFREMRDTEARKEADRQRKRDSAGTRRIPQTPPRSAQVEAEADTEAEMDGWIDGSSGSSTEHRTHKPRYTGGADVAR